jgi:hypothetical protein
VIAFHAFWLELDSSSNIIWVNNSRGTRWAGNVARIMRKRRSSYRFLVGKPEGKISSGKPRRRWGDNIKMVFQDVCWGHGLD